MLSSLTETNAASAEFKWKDIKKAEYISQHIGEKFQATITHIIGSGFFAELDNTVEGFVPARTLEDDMYIMTESGLSMIGRRTNRKFTIGDRVEIKVAAVDLADGKVDFEVVGTRALKPLRHRRKKNRSKRRKNK